MKFMKKVRVKLRQWRKHYLDFSPNTYKFIWALLFFILISLSLNLDLIPNQIDLQAGEVSSRDLTAPKTITFIDESSTARLKQQAANTAPRVYEEDSTVDQEIQNKLNSLFASVIKQRQLYLIDKLELSGSEQNSQSAEELMAENRSSFTPEFFRTELTKLSASDRMAIANSVRNEIKFELGRQTILNLIPRPEQDLLDFKNEISLLLENELTNRILPSELDGVKTKLNNSILELDLSNQQKETAAQITDSLIAANMFLNIEETEKRRKEAIADIEPVEKTVRQGEIIVRKGDVVTEQEINILERLGLQKTGIDYYNILGRLIIEFILIALLGFYFYKYQSRIWHDNSKLLLIELLIFIVILLAKIFTLFQNSLVDYMVPTAIASILLTVLIGSDTALITTLFLSLLLAPIYDLNFSIVLTSILAGLVGIFSVSKVKERGDIIRAGLNVSLALFFLIGGLYLLQDNRELSYLAWTISGGIINGILVAVLANGLLPYLEDLFNMTSSVKLLELSNPSQPVLKRLLVEAPGTYHHSIIVGNLAETAAEDIGANSLLARAAAYYHDIGKLKRPYFFSDNQFGGENPHDKTSPNLSALIIKSHVKDGVEMAREVGLPQEIIAIIQQHHGTNLISYFYQQALQSNRHDDIEKKDFSYDGPEPQSREAAIIMLADITEAAVRSKKFNKNNHDRIEGFVRGLIKDKLIENQLDKSELTLSDLDTIAKSFVKVLTGIYHQRIEYPEHLLKEVKGGN